MHLSQVHSCLLAFGFGNLAMLGWLAAAAAPILIHLWSRHRYREAPWAAMQFLLAAMQKNARRMQLQQWLLLAIRTLIIALVVLAVAEPYGERLLAGGSASPTHKILVIDGSYSMAYQPADRTNFANAKQIASQMVQQSNPADVFTVILMAAPPKVVASAELLDRVAVSRVIESLAQSHTSADLGSALALIKDALANTHVHNLSGRAEVYFLTDLQRCTWDAVAHEAGENKNKHQSEVLDNFNAIAAAASITIVDLGQSDSTNIAITSLSTSDQLVTAGPEIAFDATLHNFGAERDQLQAELLVDNVPVADQRMSISANAEAQVHFGTRFNSTGLHAITVRTTGDRLEIDNSRSLIVPVRKHIRVLCVAGREGAAKYVASALNPNSSGDSPIRPTIVAEGDLAETELKGFDCVFLCNVTQLSAHERVRLMRFVDGGGGLVTFLGDLILPDSYNSPETNQRVTTGPTRNTQAEYLLPASIGELVTQQESRIDPLEYRHPIVAPFRGRERSGLLTTPITHYYRLEVSKNRSGFAVAAAMRNGDPFIVTAKMGSGRTVLVATDASLSSFDPITREPWTTWPTWPSFLPIIRELVAYSLGGQQSHWEQPVGKPLSGNMTNVGPDAAEQRIQMLRPDGLVAPVSIDSTDSDKIWTYADADLAGIYTLRGESKDQLNQFAVNVDTSESDLAKISAKQLPDSVKILSAWKGESTGTSATIASQAEWSQSLLWIVFGLLLIESLVACQLGRGVR